MMKANKRLQINLRAVKVNLFTLVTNNTVHYLYTLLCFSLNRKF